MRKPLLVALIAATPLFAACTENADGSDANTSDDSRTIAVSSTDDKCELSATEAPSGTLTFEVTNDGSKVTEFYLLGEDGQRIVGEVENIGPQLSRQLVVSVPAGSYVTACKPAMKGDGIRADFTVKASDEEPTPAADDGAVDQALESYEDYVHEQAEELADKTETFVALYKAGKDAAARALYPQARTHWERIETVAESFGDLDPKMDAREADLEPGQKWTGWHRIEKDLWPQDATDYTPLTTKQRAFFADDLMSNTEVLERRIEGLTFTVDQIANGSRGLLEEVANGKITGEEEIWSHTDLWDFQANVDGARVGFEGLEPIIEQKNPQFARTVSERFAALQELLDAQRDGDGFVSYEQLSPDEVKQLANAVNALAEPLSQLTAVVLS
ncbi:MAG: peptidase M75 family protein [Nocardioides sp.]|nr:peptidase M75 family protein [Nocardioidaceae bacterium]MCB8956306.1 peptidase M75 family protein [Nocardioides sp.]